MKLTSILVIALTLQVSAAVSSQTVTFSGKNVGIKKVLSVIKNQTNYVFFYDVEILKNAKPISINLVNAPIEKALEQTFADQPITWIIEGKTISFVPKAVKVKESVNLTSVQKQIKGKVVDEKGIPVSGATIQVKGTKVTTVTDMDGSFVIEVPDNKAVLVISFIGMESQEVIATNNLSIVLKEENQKLNEVVVVGYGTQKKINLTGAIQSVSSKELQNRPTSTISGVLQGKVAGVTVVTSSGQPGSSGSIYIRGRGTLNNTSPLVIVDGVRGSMDGISPSDIDNITVLKDAASAAIYGSQSANGVILVTTKKGSNHAPRISYNTYFANQTPTDLPHILGSPEYAVLLNQALANEGKPARYTADQIQKFKDGSDPNHYPNTDWFDILLNGEHHMVNHYLKVDGGTEKTTYYMSVDYIDQKGLIQNSDFGKYTFRSNIETKVTDKLKLGANISYLNSNKKEPAQPYFDSFGYFYGKAQNDPPTVVGRYDDGTSGLYRDGGLAAWLDAGAFSNVNMRDFNGIFTGDLDLGKGFSVKGIGAIRNYTSIYNRFIKEVYYYNYDTKDLIKTSGPNKETDEVQTVSDINLQALLNYQRTFGNHNVHFLAGYQQEAYRLDGLKGERTNFVNNSLGELDAGSAKTMTNSGYANEWAIRSYFGRANYDYMGKYLFEANIRYDGSSRFAEGNQYGAFPSASVGWRISEENFMKEVDWLSDLKIRASYGTMGNNDVGNYPTKSILNSGSTVMNDVIIDQIYQKTAANTDLKWETTKTIDFGFDFGAFNNRLSLTVDYFNKRTDDILMNLPLPGTFGLDAPKQNAGSVQVKGWEGIVNYKDKIGEVKYNVGFNASFIDEEILDLKGTGPFISGNTIQQVGSPVKSFFGYEVEGIFRTADELANHAAQGGNTNVGDLKYKDQNADNVINEKDRVVIGDDIPKITYGINLGAEYKGWAFSAFLQGVDDVDMYLSSLNRQADQSFKEQHLDAWSPENPNGSYPRNLVSGTQNQKPSSFWIRDASYLRLKNIQLSYSFPESLIKHAKMEFLQLYVSGENVLTFTSLPDGNDPENTASIYPQVKTFSLGLNVRF